MRPRFSHNHSVGHFDGFVLIVSHDDAGEVQLLVQAAQPAPQLVAHLAVQRTERLIQQQHLRIHGHGARQGHPLLLAAG